MKRNASPFLPRSGEAFLQSHFPTIDARCRGLGIDISKQPIPVCRGHYTCGGVVTDCGAAPTWRAWYAVGETGAPAARRQPPGQQLRCSNASWSGRRAPSTSWSKSKASHARCRPGTRAASRTPTSGRDLAQLDELRLTMWNYVGIVRTTGGWSGRSTHPPAARETDEYYCQLPCFADLLGTAQPAGMRRHDRAIGPETAREPRPALQRDYPQTLPGACDHPGAAEPDVAQGVDLTRARPALVA